MYLSGIATTGRYEDSAHTHGTPPKPHGFFEAVFDACAANGALLLTYRGREGMNLVMKA